MWTALVALAAFSAPIILSISYVPQIWKIFQTKDASSQSLSFWYILDLSLFMLFVLALDTYVSSGDWTLLLAQSLNLILALVVTTQTLVYQKK